MARDPGGDFHFHRGPRYAAEYLRYDADELALLPDACTARFAGVGNPLRVGPIHPGETVLMRITDEGASEDGFDSKVIDALNKHSAFLFQGASNNPTLGEIRDGWLEQLRRD